MQPKDRNVGQIVSHIIKNVQKLNHFTIVYHDSTDAWKDVYGYDLIYDGIEKAFEQNQIDHIIRIKVEEKISVTKIVNILKQIKKSKSNGIIMIFKGMFIFNENDFDSDPIQTIEEVQLVLKQVIAKQDFTDYKIEHTSNQDALMMDLTINFTKKCDN